MYTTKQNMKRIEQLIREHPAIGTILEWERATNTSGIIPEIDLVVNRADVNLMMFQGERIDGFKSSIVGEEVEGNPVIITKNQVVYYINHDNQLWDMIAWNGSHSRRVKEIFEFCEKNSPDNLKYLILVTIYDSYQKDPEFFRKHPKGLGKYIAQKISLQLCLPPKEGFAKLLETVDPMVNIRLHLDDMIRSIATNDPIYNTVLSELRKLAKQFEREVYCEGLMEIINASNIKGMSGKFNSTTLKTYTMCGRIMFTFEKDNDDITFICAENEVPSRMGFQSINATWPCAKSMVEEVINAWKISTVPINERMKNNKNLNIG